MSDLNDTQQVEADDQSYTGDLSDLLSDESAFETAPSGEVVEQEATAEADPEPEESSGYTSHETFNALDAALGELEELQHDGFYEKIDESHINELPPTARRILHNFRVDRKLSQEKHVEEMEALKTAIEERERALQGMESDFLKRQTEFAALIDDPDVQAILNEPEGELDDPFTEAGIEQRIQRGIAKGMSAILQPMKAAADRTAQNNDYWEFVEAHPEMKDEGFKDEVLQLVTSRAEEGFPISTQDAYSQIKARRIIAQQQMRAAQEQRARQQSARRIGRAVQGGNPTNGEIPPEIKKQGSSAIVQWFQDNPEAYKQYRQNFR